jgi:hypothetical protein
LTPGPAWRWGIPPIRKLGTRHAVRVMKGASDVRLAGLAAVRITWIIAIVVCVLAVLSGLLSGTDGRNSSRQFPGFAFTDGGDSSSWPQFPGLAFLDPTAALVGGDAQEIAAKTQQTDAAGPQGSPGQRVNEQAPGDSHSRAGVPPPGSQPGGTGGRPPSSAPGPNRPQAPTPGPNRPQVPTVSLPKLPKAPTVTVDVPKPPQPPTVSVSVPKAPQAPSGTSAPSLPLPQVSVNVSSPVQTPIVKIPDVSVSLP